MSRKWTVKERKDEGKELKKEGLKEERERRLWHEQHKVSSKTINRM
jgi:hypothetical protein